MRIVVALGGNALLQRGQKPDAEPQIDNAKAAMRALAPLVDEHEVVITHGNGPQVGVLAIESANDERLSKSYPFDTLGAMTEGMIGYWILQAIGNERPQRQYVAMINQTLVGADDPAFGNPTKFVGEVMEEDEAHAAAERNGWTVKPDGAKWRRVVPSPIPTEIIEQEQIRILLDNGIICVCAGGGGVPVVREADGSIRGVEAVIDKDLSAALMASSLQADRLLILTDVEAVIDGFGTPEAKPITKITADELRAMEFPAGSMGPKVQACLKFLDNAGEGAAAVIGRLEDAAKMLNGEAGTFITR